MRLLDTINTYIEQYLKNHELYSAYGTVTKVNDEWCEVDLEGKAPVKVRLSFENGDFCLVPKVGSRCIVTFTSATEAYLAFVEKLDKVCVNADTEITLNGGKNGGLVRSEVIAQKLNAVIQDINRLKDLWKAAVPSPGDGGTAIKAAITPWASVKLSSVNKTDFENDKIKH